MIDREKIMEMERRGRKKAVQVLYEAWKTKTLGALNPLGGCGVRLREV